MGQVPKSSATLITCKNFLRCFDRVLDMVAQPEPTALEELCREARVPYVRGIDLFELQAQYSREAWLKEYRRHIGRGDDARSRRPRMVIKRRRG